MSHDPLDRIRRLDPARHPDPAATDATARTRRNAMLERVLAAPQEAPAAAVPPSRRPRRYVGRIAVGVAAVALVGTVLVAHGIGRGDQGAFTGAQLASWTATPTPRSTPELSEGARSWCRDSTARQSDAPAAFSNGDQRGDIASMVVTRGAYRDLCLATGDGHGYWEILDGPSTALPVLAARAANLQSSSSHGDPATSVNTAWGQVGAGVAGLRFRVDGREVTATVGGGIWSAWWPGRIGFDAPDAATVTYTDGSSATIRLPQA